MNHQHTIEADTAAIRALLQETVEAWGRGDGAAYGAQFTDDATDVTFVGTVYQGGEEIGRAHQALFDSFLKGTRLAMEILDIRFCGRDAAVVVSRGDTYKDKPKKLGKVQTYTVVRCEDGRWRIAAIQKTKRQGLMEAVSFRFQPATKPRTR
ncbi:SgcJ/EcaC family oxidoreductase [Nonomuraea sp. SMC257]|uniref:SgcJ/EcaC family oxidoreductase n=2 Tax=Nonomuraea montanisoli TaxID=2741721 RepID=A0A7Y6IC15_9ACTN|nr:SgcJ/EcaC family oxidoreductase [Nonomuraea montanisoli]